MCVLDLSICAEKESHVRLIKRCGGGGPLKNVTITISPSSWSYEVHFDWGKKPHHWTTPLMCSFKSVVWLLSSAGCKLNWSYSFHTITPNMFSHYLPLGQYCHDLLTFQILLCVSVTLALETLRLETCLWINTPVVAETWDQAKTCALSLVRQCSLTP